MSWQPIETAPKDGRKIDLWVVGFECGPTRWADAQWLEESQHACNGPADWCLNRFPLHAFFDQPRATHWMPPPPPPEPAQ